jgi:hypothetical protein
MRIRKIKDKDIDAAVVLLERSGVSVTAEDFTQRLHHFLYKRNHAVVVIENRGRLMSLMHIGVEPSLTKDRVARVYSLFIDQDKMNTDIKQYMLRYGEDWAQLHGCLFINDIDDAMTRQKPLCTKA